MKLNLNGANRIIPVVEGPNSHGEVARADNDGSYQTHFRMLKSPILEHGDSADEGQPSRREDSFSFSSSSFCQSLCSRCSATSRNIYVMHIEPLLCGIATRIARSARRILDCHVPVTLRFQYLTLMGAIYVLFGDVVRLTTPKAFDPIFKVLTLTALTTLLLDFVLSIIGRTSWWVKRGPSPHDGYRFCLRGYLFSFGCWIDLFCITSIVLELVMFNDEDAIAWNLHLKTFTRPITPILISAFRTFRVFYLIHRHVAPTHSSYTSSSSSPSPSSLLHHQQPTSSASSSSHPHPSSSSSSHSLRNRYLPHPSITFVHGKQGAEDEGSSRGEAKSNIATGTGRGKSLETELYDLTMQRLITALFWTLLALAAFSHTSLHDPSLEIGTTLLYDARATGNFTLSDLVLSTYVQYFRVAPFPQACGGRLISLQLDSSLYLIHDTAKLEALRSAELYSLTLGHILDAPAYVSVIFDISHAYRKRVLMEQLYFPLFLVLLLLLGANAFSHDAQQMIIIPIDWIINIVRKLAADPLAEIDLDNNNALKSEYAQFETTMIANSIRKITRLLRIGFGIAGAEIITSSLDLSKTGAMLDPLLPGKRVMSIIGFCDIHDFDFIVKALDKEVMAFVNQVAVIVHENTSLWKGACNKNLGNAFLIIWRIGDEEKLLNVSRSLWSTAGAASPSGGGGNMTHLDVRRIPGVEALADQALIGFLKVLVALKRDKKIRALCSDPRLRRNGEDFQLGMHFGLHAGWAIEGAVGSAHKVDATYLSPHVNLAARMETAAQQYHVPVLMTDGFHEILSTEARRRCRKIDTITVKGSATPRSIHTYDAYLGQSLPTRSSFKTYSPDIWKKDKDLLYLQEQTANDQFRSTFQVGLTNYINGLWTQAAENFRNCDALLAHIGGDGPSRTLLDYMARTDYQCPSNWEGYRPLTNK